MSLKISLRVPGGDKAELLKTKGLLSVSMGIDKILMRDDCLKKTIYAINNTFESCHIVISDVLQRFNLMIKYPELSEEEAFAMAYEVGESWFTDNTAILNEFKIPYQIFRWTDWLNKNSYKEKERFIYELFDHDTGFRFSVAESIKKYYERKSVMENIFSLQDYLELDFKSAHRFILEEAAVMLLWCDAGYDFELHTSNRNAALVYAHTLYHNNNGVIKLKQSRIKVLGDYNEIPKAA